MDIIDSLKGAENWLKAIAISKSSKKCYVMVRNDVKPEIYQKSQ